MNTFTEILHNELGGTGVLVQVLCPGLVSTEFHERTGTKPQVPPESIMKPEAVVHASLAGLRQGEVVCIPALDDPNLVTQHQESERRIIQQARAGRLANRYML